MCLLKILYVRFIIIVSTETESMEAASQASMDDFQSGVRQIEFQNQMSRICSYKLHGQCIRL
jgi:hypothetical protein